MPYIEKDRPGEFFNPVSSTVAINPDKVNSDDQATKPLDPDSEENVQRWQWLISGWKDMSFKEKMALYKPYLHYINARNKFKPEFDEYINNEITEASYRLCRDFISFKFDPDGQGIPNIIVQFASIDPFQIPDSYVKAQVLSWGKKFGFLPAFYDDVIESEGCICSHQCTTCGD